MRTHLERLRHSTRVVDPRLLIAWPAAGWALWLAYHRMANVSCAEIDAYSRLHGVSFTVWELDMLELFGRLAHEAKA